MTDCQSFERRLAAYVDGELAADDRADLQAHAQACPACRAGARAEQEARDLVRDRASRLVQAAPAALVARCASMAPGTAPATSARAGASRLRRWVPLSLAATLVLAVSGVFLFSLNSPVAALATQLTLDHMKCFTLTDGEAAQPTTFEEVTEIVTRICGRPVAVPGNRPSEGLRLVGARRCFLTDGQVAHVLYEHDGHPLSLFVLPDESKEDRKSEIMGHETFWWSDGDATYALVARAADGTVGRAATVVQRAIR